MEDLELRAMTADDVAAVAALMAAVEAEDRTGEHYDQDDLVEELADPRLDPTTDWVLAHAGGRLVGQWRLFPGAVKRGVLPVSLDGCTHPAYRGLGVGSRLLPDAVARAGAYVGQHAPAATARVSLAGRSDDDALADLARRNGLAAHRWAFTLGTGLPAAAAADARLAEGLRLDASGPEDHRAMLAVHNEVFVDHPDFGVWDAPKWDQWVAGARSFRPGLTWLVRDGDQIVSYLHTHEYDAVLAATGVREAYVAKVGTVRSHRGRGLASLLLRHALAAYHREGFGRAALDVDSQNPTGALGIYLGAGFEVEQRWTTYRLG